MAKATDWSKLSPLSIAAGAAGVALGAYSALNLLFPAFFAVVAWFGLRNMAPSAKQAVVPAIAWQIGQLGWFIGGAALSHAALMQIWPDILILAGLLIWFYIGMGRIAAWVLIAYQALSVLINAWMFTRAPLDSMQDKALAVHIVWRVVAIVLLALFIRRRPELDPAQTAKAFE
jgi:hypothetical protein